jgi:DNA-binding IclR family transcriptional regulator
MAKRAKESYTIQSVVHALQLLEQFHNADGELGVTDLARRLGLHKNNVFRLLATLETQGYVVQNLETEDYRLGVRALELGRSYLRQSSIVNVAGPLVAQLRDETGETAHLSILQGEEVVYLISEESQRAVRVAGRPGAHLPALATASGRTQLAWLRELPYTLHPLRRLSDPRPTDIKRLEKDLDRIREQGYGLDLGESDPDVACVAAPIFDDEGRVVGAFSVSAPLARMDAAIREALVQKVTEVAELASRNLGWDGASEPVSEVAI